jgi:hypothetical protein
MGKWLECNEQKWIQKLQMSLWRCAQHQ